MTSQVVDLDTGVELGPGADGELCFRGPQVMLGYLNKPEANKFTLRNGWIHTGIVLVKSFTHLNQNFQ